MGGVAVVVGALLVGRVQNFMEKVTEATSNQLLINLSPCQVRGGMGGVAVVVGLLVGWVRSGQNHKELLMDLYIFPGMGDDGCCDVRYFSPWPQPSSFHPASYHPPALTLLSHRLQVPRCRL